MGEIEMGSACRTNSGEELFSVKGKVVVVTGGVRGLGRMIVDGFVAEGARVLVVSRSPETSVALPVGEVTVITGDLSTPQGVERVTERIMTIAPAIDVLVNNAGVTWIGSLEDHPAEAFDVVWAVNVKAMFALTVGLLPGLRETARRAGSARVINIGSIDGVMVSPFRNYAYAASKAAVHLLTQRLARDLAGERITVNVVAPGLFETSMTRAWLDDPVQQAALVSEIPLGRAGSADDIVGTVMFLASSAGSYITGAMIPVDGGVLGCR